MKKNKEKKVREKRVKSPAGIKRSWISRFDLLNRFRHWWVGGKSITRSIFRVAAAWQGVAILTALLTGGYVLAAFYTGAGEFVIRVDNPADDSLQLCDTPDFKNPLVLLKGKPIDQADNISIFDIDPLVTETDGPHNSDNYVAYTFYLRNASMLTTDYQYTLSIRSTSKNVESATWVMLYHNGKQNIYAKNGVDGKAESQSSEFRFPFNKDAQRPGEQMLELSSGYELRTVPFASDKMVCTAQRKELTPGEIDKFTVVIWLEGEDPECVDAILGGHIEMMMRFTY